MPAKKGKKAPKSKNHVDVRTTEDVMVLKDLIKKNKLMAILIYADYCGHCHTYMDGIWNGLIEDPSRKNGMASIHYDQLEKTPLANTTISGYPTVLVLGEDKSPMSFKNEETGKNELEFPESRNKEKMSEILNSEPETVMSYLNEGDMSNYKETLNHDEDSKQKRLNSKNADPNRIISGLNTEKPSLKPKKMASVPNYTTDMLNSQGEKNSNASKTIEFVNESGSKPGRDAVGGGSLFKSLMQELNSPKQKTRKRKGRKSRRA
jgi:hypothetical protein